MFWVWNCYLSILRRHSTRFRVWSTVDVAVLENDNSVDGSSGGVCGGVCVER